MPNDAATPLLVPGETCWRVARADKLAVLVDASDYFRTAKQAMLRARHSVILVGWDFDARITLEPQGQTLDGPNRVGAFLNWLAKRRKSLRIGILKWDLGMLQSLGRGETPAYFLRWLFGRRVRMKLDGAHPPSAAHHQKLLVVDDALAFCGGIDMTVGRWDTPEHAEDAPARHTPRGEPCPPWHDATTCADGPLAQALGELARERWKRATGEDWPAAPGEGPSWPEELEPLLQQVEVGIARTMAAYGDEPQVSEIEALTLRLIATARHSLYIESQYFASRRVAEAMAARLQEPDGPEILLINPESADGWLEQATMDAARVRLVHMVHRADRHGRFRILHPVNAAGTPIYVHAKIMIMDDRVLKIGSANLNNRSMGHDTECDLAVDAALAADPEGTREAILALRHRLLAEHLDCDAAAVAAAVARHGTLIGAMEALASGGRRLQPLPLRELSAAEETLAESDLVDPERPPSLKRQIRSLFRRRR